MGIIISGSSDNISSNDGSWTATGLTLNGGAIGAGTSFSTSGLSTDFTGIPSWTKRITVIFSATSLSASASYRIQIGTASGIESSGYVGAQGAIANSNVTTASVWTGSGADFAGGGTSFVHHGSVTINNIGANIWVFNGTFGNSNTAQITYMGGSKTLSGTLDRVRITTSNGTDTFDAGGIINILYEG